MSTRSKSKPTFECVACGAQYIRWQGQCDSCEQWNGIEPITIAQGPSKGATRAVRLCDVAETNAVRTASGFDELDRVLGSGWTCGSVNLICGEPGIGKSTLVLQSSLACAASGQNVLYFTAEESAIQVKERAKRLVTDLPDTIYIAATTDMDVITTMIETMTPDVIVLDSIQMVMSTTISSMPGAINQIRLCTAMFIQSVKAHHAVGILVGHITKDGQLAGPKVLEHMVDVILLFEGERMLSVRMLRSLKNRYGTTNETGLFCMKHTGLRELNGSHLMSNLQSPPLAGSIITGVLSGTRGMLVELQSLVVQGGYQQIKRTCVGLDSHRCYVMIAVLDKFFSMKLTSNDIFLSLVGGIKSPLPDMDLAICFSIWSSYYSRPIEKSVVVLGEVGLTGEILPIAHLDRYIGAMTAMGISMCVLPNACAPDWPESSTIQPLFVDTIFSAHTRFKSLALSPSHRDGDRASK